MKRLSYKRLKVATEFLKTANEDKQMLYTSWQLKHSRLSHVLINPTKSVKSTEGNRYLCRHCT